MKEPTISLPAISFVVPVYGVEAYVGKCLESIVADIGQFPGSEVIVVNDGTKDRSMDIVERIAALHPCIRILNQPNQGLSVARNNGMALAKGDYIWLIDSDDWLEPGALHQLRLTMIAHPDMDLYVTGLNDYYPDGNVVADLPAKEYPEMDGWRFIEIAHITSAVQRYVMRRALLERERITFIPGILHEDNPFAMQLLAFARTVMVLPTTVYGYRIREGSIMKTPTMRCAYDLITGHRALMAFCDERVPQERRLWFKGRNFCLIYSAYGRVIPLMDTPEFAAFQQAEGDYIHARIREVMKIAKWRERWKMWCILHYPRWYFRRVLPVWLKLTAPWSRYLRYRRSRK